MNKVPKTEIKNNMNKEFIPYTEALALKELGFNEPCFAVYSEHDKTRVYEESSIVEGLKIQAPLYQQAFYFFREKYDLHRHICYFSDTNVWHVDIYKTKNNGLMNHPMELTNYTTYEEAELACLIKLIKIVKNK
jgi:hypothetical protein